MEGLEGGNGEVSSLEETFGASEPRLRAGFGWRLPRRRAGFRTAAKALAWFALLAVAAATLSPAAGRPYLLRDAAAEWSGAHFLLGLRFCVGYRRRWLAGLVFVLAATAGPEALSFRRRTTRTGCGCLGQDVR